MHLQFGDVAPLLQFAPTRTRGTSSSAVSASPRSRYSTFHKTLLNPNHVANSIDDQELQSHSLFVFLFNAALVHYSTSTTVQRKLQKSEQPQTTTKQNLKPQTRNYKPPPPPAELRRAATLPTVPQNRQENHLRRTYRKRLRNNYSTRRNYEGEERMQNRWKGGVREGARRPTIAKRQECAAGPQVAEAECQRFDVKWRRRSRRGW
jgi:hypothetical protein